MLPVESLQAGLQSVASVLNSDLHDICIPHQVSSSRDPLALQLNVSAGKLHLEKEFLPKAHELVTFHL